MDKVERPRVEEVLDYVFYAPLGALFHAAEELPGLLDEGRGRFESRLNTARATGRFAVAAARHRLDSFLGSAPAPTETSEARTSPDEPEPGSRSRLEDVDVFDLAIPGYDSLAASQVVARLAGLSPEERAAVKRYELATRARRTVLGRIAQLDDGAAQA
jgi:hypothetical protein